MYWLLLAKNGNRTSMALSLCSLILSTAIAHAKIDDCRLDEITVKGVGVEPSGNWAIFETSASQENEVINEGAVLNSCYRIKKITSSLITLSNLHTGEEHFLYISTNTQNSSLKPALEAGPRSEQEQLLRATRDSTIDYVSDSVRRINYPPFSNTGDLPRTIFINRYGSKLFEDHNKLGIGEESIPGSTQGVRIGKNSNDSLLGGCGFVDGDIIVAVAGRDVKFSTDITQALQDAKSSEPIRVDYIDGNRVGSGIMSEYLMIVNK